MIDKIKKTCKMAGLMLCCFGVISLSAQGCAAQNQAEQTEAERIEGTTAAAEDIEETIPETESLQEKDTAETEPATEEEKERETAVQTQPADVSQEESFVADLEVADEATQLIVVETDTAESREAVVTMHQLTDGRWEEILRTDGYVGYNGIDKERQGDRKTPTGLYHVSTPFGLGSDPGSREPYTQVDEHYWWVGDSDSRYYNQLVRDDVADRDWNEEFGEHLIDYGDSYRYCLFIEYNTQGIADKGSCIFLHCNGQNPYTMGCISIPEEDMIFVLQNVGEDCYILIDTTENLANY